MQLHVLYRLYPPESHKSRPAFHDKLTCLDSFLRSAAGVPGCTFTVLVDASDLPAPFADLLAEHGVQHELLGGLGNAGSYQVHLQRACALPADDLVYLGEDDYLCVPEALSLLQAAATELQEAEYFTLYDHLDRYTRDDDARLPGRQVWYAGGRHWRRVESTCMSYAARVGALREDAGAHRAANAQYPDDRKIWRHTQGVGRYWWKRPKRVLVSPMPSLATHMDAEFLAPGVDWSQVAEALRSGRR